MDLDTLIKWLVETRAEHGNVPVVRVGGNLVCQGRVVEVEYDTDRECVTLGCVDV